MPHLCREAEAGVKIKIVLHAVIVAVTLMFAVEVEFTTATPYRQHARKTL